MNQSAGTEPDSAIRDVRTPKRGIHLFAIPEDGGANRRLVIGFSFPWAPAAYRRAGIIFFCVALLLPSALCALKDRTVWPWDQAWYGEVSVDLWFLLNHSIPQWLRVMQTGLSSKPPALVWIGQFFVPLGAVFGSIEPPLLLSVVATELTLLILLYRISRCIDSSSYLPASIAVASAASAQVFVGLSHQYLVEPLQAVAVAWFVLIALRSAEWPRARVALHLVCAACLGMMVKVSTPLYVAVPGVVAIYNLLKGQKAWDFRTESRRASSKALASGLVVTGGFGALWYRRNLLQVIQHVRDSSSGDAALDYGFRAAVTQKTVLWAHYVRSGFLDPYLVWMLALLIAFAAIAMLAVRGRFADSRRSLMILLLSLLQIGLGVVAFAFNDAMETRYLAPLAPFLAILFVALCSIARLRWLQVLVLAVCLAQWAVVNRGSFEPAPVLVDQFPWLKPITTDRAAYDAITQVVQDTSTAPGYNIVAIEEPWINANTLAFFAAKNRLFTGVRSDYTSFGYAQKDPAAAMKRIDEFSARYVITLDEGFQKTPDFLNVVTLPVLRELESSDHYHLSPRRYPKGILVFERTVPANSRP